MKFIKNIYTTIAIALFAFASLYLFSCKKEKSDKIPSITSIVLSRVDTTIYGPGRYIDIKGNGFDDVQQILFNNLSTYVNPSYVTSSNIVVKIPSDFPDTITNIVTLITRNKSRYDFDFTVDVPKPVINQVAYTLSQNLITISGANLAKTKQVTIGGINVAKYTISSDYKTISFLAPTGVPAGNIKVVVTCPPGNAESLFNLDEAAKPAIVEIPCEWVDAGKTLQLNGRNLALVSKVTINTTDVESGFVYNTDNTVLKIPMPAGIASGNVTVKVINQLGIESNVYTMKYKTSQFLIWNFDDQKQCWGAPDSHLANLNNISGNYAVWEGTIAPSWWDQNNMFCGCGNPTPSATITSNPANYVLKFEINVVNPWSVGSIRFSFNDDDIAYDWIPYTVTTPYTTDGWKTISIPLTSWTFNAALNGNYRLKFFTGGAAGDAMDTKIYFDNLRIDNAN